MTFVGSTAYVVHFVLIIGVGCDLYKQFPLEIENSERKLAILSHYNEVIRWRRNSCIDRLPDTATVHFLGGDIDQIYMLLPKITENIKDLKSEINYQGETPMWVAVSIRYYLLVQFIMKGFKVSWMREWTCGSLISPEELVPDQGNLFTYVNNPSNKDKKPTIFIKKYLKTFKNEEELKNNIDRLKKKGKVTEALSELREVVEYFFKLTWFGKHDVDCKENIPGIKALIAIEYRLLETLPDDKCFPRLLNENISLDSALKNVDEVFADEEILHAMYKDWAVELFREEYVGLRKITTNRLALLTLECVRSLVMDYVLLDPWDQCKNCDCRMLDRITEFRNSILRIEKIIPGYGMQCKESWLEAEKKLKKTDKIRKRTEKNRKKTPEQTLFEYLVENKSSLIEKIKQIPGIDGVFEIFSTEMEYYFRKPYIGIPFSDMPIKHASWLIASHLFDYDNCQQFIDVQILRQRLESYSDMFYYVDSSSLDQCGLLPTTDTEDSMIMTVSRQDIIQYDMARTYNYTEILAIQYRDWNMGFTENYYEFYLSAVFDMDIELSADEIEKRVNYYLRNFELHGDDKYLENNAISSFEWGNLSCEFNYIIAAMKEYHMVKYMNFIEGRLYPFSYEKDILTKSRNKLAERDRAALSGCRDVDTTFEAYKKLTKNVLSLDMMQDPDIFSMYTTYMEVEELDLKPTELEDLIEQANFTYFKSKVDERLQKSSNLENEIITFQK